MAKHTCAICGAEVGLISEEKLADGTSDFIQKILNSNTAEAAMQTFVASMESAAVK